LREQGFSDRAIEHRVARGRLHRKYPGVYAVGRPELTRKGEILAAVLACGPGAAVSHETAAEHYGIRHRRRGPIHVSVPSSCRRRIRGIRTHRRNAQATAEFIEWNGVPVTSPTLTIIDLANGLSDGHLIAAVNEADGLELIDPELLRTNLDRLPGQPGVARLRKLLDPLTYRMSRSELERRMLPLVRRAGLGVPQTNVEVNGFEVDFYWPALGLVVEADSLRYHRTPAQQQRDWLRDQTHLRAGMTPLRFTHADIRYEPERVLETLRVVSARVRSHAA
jgi:very-short-patch-repair endonuclease